MVDVNQVLDIIVSGNLNRVIAAIVVLLIAFIAARFVRNLTAKVLRELKTNKILKESLGVRAPIEQIFSEAGFYLVLFIGVILALNQLGLSTIVLYIVLGAVLLIILILVVMAFKDFVPNVAAGFFIHQKRNLNDGDYIKINDVEGEIININLVETKIKTKNGDIMYIPNSMLTKNNVRKMKKK